MCIERGEQKMGKVVKLFNQAKVDINKLMDEMQKAFLKELGYVESEIVNGNNKKALEYISQIRKEISADLDDPAEIPVSMQRVDNDTL